jgi:hypothetical protein
MKWCCALAVVLMVVAPCSAGLIFHDPLRGGTLGTNNNVTIFPNRVVMTHADSWVQYPDPEIPSAQGTISCWVRITPGCTGSIFMSNAYQETGTPWTWPTFVIYLHYVEAAGKYKAHLSYWNNSGPPHWRRLETAADLHTAKWYHLGFTWGPQGMEIWVDGVRTAHDPSITDPHQHPVGYPHVAWGLGRFYTNGEPATSCRQLAVRDLRVYDTVQAFGGTNAAPVLGWAGTPGFVADGIDPDCAPHDSQLAFRVRYSDREGTPPSGGVLLHLRRNGTPLPHSPFAMRKGGSSNFRAGVVYRFARKLRFGDYSYRFAATDGDLAAVGPPTAWQQGPEVITPPVLSQPRVIPVVGDAATKFRYGVDYTTLDGKPARWVELQILRYEPGTGWQRTRFRKRGVPAGSSAVWARGLASIFPDATRFRYRFRAMKGHPPCRLFALTDWTPGPRLTDGSSGMPALSSLTAIPTPHGGAQIVFSLSAPAEVTARVLNIAGRPVRALAPLTAEQGLNTLLWDGKNGTGLAAPGGRYLVEVTARGPNGAQTRALTPLHLTR